MLEKTFERPLDCKEIKPINPKGNQSWIFVGQTDAEASILWSPDVKSWLIGKYPNAGKDWGQEEKGTTENEMVGWHHWLNGHGFGWTPRVGDGQGGLVCWGSWGRKELDMTEQLNWTELMRPHAMIFIFWMLSFKPTFSLSSFTFIKRLFSSSLSALRVVSSAYLRLLIFLPAILIPAYASSSPVFFSWCTLHIS